MRYFIVYNNDKIVFHYGTLTEKQFLSTGLDNTFLTENKKEFVKQTSRRGKYQICEWEFDEPRTSSKVILYREQCGRLF